ncbi:MAG: hypothetical protein HQ596_04775 [Candidatus Saganbacteria bacterium]|nr:hypothetical protein [Candidatus Saganbacteria bacterium]
MLRLRRPYDHAIAYFHFRERDEDCIVGFSLFPDQFRRIGRVVSEESFDTTLLQEMTGEKPTFLKYCFCKATDSDGIMRPGFVNKSAIEIRGSRRDSKVFAPHTQYYWKIVRENGSSNARLLIYCYTEPEMQEASLFAVGTTNLKSGSISGLITLYPPEQIIS